MLAGREVLRLPSTVKPGRHQVVVDVLAAGGNPMDRGPPRASTTPTRSADAVRAADLEVA
jgi:NADPH:quinone reductase-like Zn-dependent oxidoreductase